MRDELKTFTENLKIYMDYYQMTQTELATRLNTDQATVSRWIAGIMFPRIGKIDEMCAVFHCSRSDLIEREQSYDTIKRKLKLNKLMARVDMLNDDGIDKTISFIEDLSERYKVQ